MRSIEENNSTEQPGTERLKKRAGKCPLFIYGTAGNRKVEEESGQVPTLYMKFKLTTIVLNLQ
jgi:hypothetical protein